MSREQNQFMRTDVANEEATPLGRFVCGRRSNVRLRVGNQTFLRRLAMKPIAPRPASIRAYVSGSGTGVTSRVPE